ncbi:MAG: hypothetical protein AB1938_11815 [Myxococcota bacterium]
MNTLRIGFLGLAAAVAGFALSGCFASQPAPECNITQTSGGGLGLGPYHVQLTKIDGTGTCSEMKYINVGMQRSRLPPAMGTTTPVTTEFTLNLKPSPAVDMYNGLRFFADYDSANDCTKYTTDDCSECFNEGDALPDGGVAGARDNLCVLNPDPVYRVDPNDMSGTGQLGTAKLPQFPVDGVCTPTDFAGMEQNFQEEVVDLVDGGTEVFPALLVKTEWTNFEILSTAKAPGTVWRAKLKYTEGTCVANYDAFAFWPEIHCGGETQEIADDGCDPKENLNTQCFPETGGASTISADGGCDTGFILVPPRVLGSGINPEFKPKCDMDVGVCKPTVTWDELKN